MLKRVDKVDILLESRFVLVDILLESRFVLVDILLKVFKSLLFCNNFWS